ncbi:tetratricopeptide repeat-containing glycosyltransferase family 2 protein [Agathobaculum sp.]|uniref:tetratricopeptide repeat-containing glycosyltransferase family 2 protein n=1 Tax=Agathobaculum sp. TaxID=2048138 RepID=UPI002A828F9A|nr:glycosyltransferase [Agathobaculum sp.]MDY3619021.1 glycosyltransferase [Agathobaculum sp.]
MVTISLCMIVKNEESVLARCLDSVKDLVDEVIVADTGSSDRTREIAAAYGQVYDFPWCDDFSAARNFSFSKASMDYCMWLDADDVIAPGDHEKFRSMKKTLDPSVDVVMLPYQTVFDEAGKPTFTYFRERLLKNGRGFQWQGAVHECIAPCGHIEYGEAAVQHRKQGAGDPNRNLRLYEKQLRDGKSLDARGLFYYARELLTHKRYADAEQVFSAFLARPDGWLENRIEACRQLAECRLALGKTENALQALLSSFAIDIPRAETCCALGALLMGQEQYRQAAFWYETALRSPRNTRTGGFILEDCYGYLPCIQLCVCYDRLGDYETAEAMNERAAGFRPDSAAVAYNRAYFADRKVRV